MTTLLLLCLAAKPGAASSDVQALVERMQRFYEHTRDFTAKFRQDYTYQSFHRTVTSTGTVSFRKPAQMRWEYETPQKRTFVLSHDRVYAWDPEGQTLTKAALPTSELSASVTFLWGRGRLADEFSFRKLDCAGCQGVLLGLTPLRPDPRFREIRLELDSKTAQVLRSTVVDPDGSENVIAYRNLETNVGLPNDAFTLSPPDGTQIVDLTKPKP